MNVVPQDSEMTGSAVWDSREGDLVVGTAGQSGFAAASLIAQSVAPAEWPRVSFSRDVGELRNRGNDWIGMIPSRLCE